MDTEGRGEACQPASVPYGHVQNGTGAIRFLEIDCAGKRQKVAISSEHVTIGRGSGFAKGAQHIELSDDDTVSRRHAALTIRPDWACVVDLESSNRTRLNDVPLTPLVEMMLNDGDVLTLGERTRIVCRVHDEEV